MDKRSLRRPMQAKPATFGWMCHHSCRKDLNTFTQAMRSWDYRPCGLRLLIVVKHPTLSPQQHFRKCQSFLESISQRYSWTFGSDVAPDRIRGSSWVKEVDSQIIVMFTTRNTRIELDEFWTDNLLVTQQDGQIIRIQNVSEESDGLHNYTWYTNFHSPNPSISKSPFSHNTLSGVIKVLRAYGERDKLLLSCSKFKAWTYIHSSETDGVYCMHFGCRASINILFQPHSNLTFLTIPLYR